MPYLTRKQYDALAAALLSLDHLAYQIDALQKRVHAVVDPLRANFPTDEDMMTMTDEDDPK